MNKFTLLSFSMAALFSNSAFSWSSDACPVTEPACSEVSNDLRPNTFPEAELAKGKIVFSFGGDGCLASSPVRTISLNSLVTNPGIALGGRRDGHCAYKDQLDRATVAVNEFNATAGNVRYKARIFSVYFVKDQTLGLVGGHTHDWEDVVIWFKNDVVEYIGASQHGPIKNYLYGEVPHIKDNQNAFAFKYVYHSTTHNFSKEAGKLDSSTKRLVATNINPTPSGRWFGEDNAVYLDFTDLSFKSPWYWRALLSGDYGDATYKGLKRSYITQSVPPGWPKNLVFK